MADHVDQINMHDAMLSANIFSVKEEQCQEDSFVEDKVCITETVITVDNAEFQGPIRYDQIKQYEESFELTEEQNDKVKVEGGISADNIKIKFDNGLLYCEHCEAYYIDYCIECGMLVHILNKHVLNSADKGARKDIPNDILEIQDLFGQTGIYALRIIPEGVKFGPFTGLAATECPWEMKGEKFVMDRNKSKHLNWMQYVNPTMKTSEGNLRVFQCEDNIYYQSTRQIQPRDELLVYFSEEYLNSLNKIDREDSVITMKDIVKDIFACTLCCLGFSSKSHLAKHKTVCIEDPSGKFSIEELTQCPFCKINLDQKEYYEHHMTFCCERNARKCILPTPAAKEATTGLNRRKRCLRQIYKCGQCKYRTKNQANLKEHTSNHHYIVKMYKCGMCSRRFKTKEILRLHVENAHAYIGGKNNQKHSSIDYRNTHMKVEQSSSQDQQKMFKCSLCVFRTKYKHCLEGHINSKHLKQLNFKCDKCEFGTNQKSYLEVHIKSKHLKQFDFKCDSCEYETNRKNIFIKHIKTKHLKKFDYKCDSCEFGTNYKRDLDVHIKTIHFRKFDYKCESCKFETNDKSNLVRHIKTKHLKKFHYKCDSCEYRTNGKRHLEIHVNGKHLKQFNYKCDSCEYRANENSNLQRHIKAKHLMHFDYKCDSCEYRTNNKNTLKLHIKTKHSREFDYKCKSCKFVTNNITDFKKHIKTKHLKKFDHHCDSCEYRTNHKNHLKLHIKTKHSREFDYKCDSCEYRTSSKDNLEVHIKTKHLKKFDYNCDSCQYRTNKSSNLKRHIETKHLKEVDYKCDVNLEQTTKVI